jgi:hypothetical protein
MFKVVDWQMNRISVAAPNENVVSMHLRAESDVANDQDRHISSLQASLEALSTSKTSLSNVIQYIGAIILLHMFILWHQPNRKATPNNTGVSRQF